MVFKMPKTGGRRQGAGRPIGTGKWGEPTKQLRGPIGAVSATLMFWAAYAACKCVITAMQKALAQLETNEKKK
jgi:hypothetical protein